MQEMKVFAGTSNIPLAQKIAEYLEIKLSQAEIRTFSDGEIFVEIGENTRGAEVFVIQSTSHPVNNHLMELLIMIDALKRASAKSITAVIPYYGYARQDRKVQPRTPITAKLVADLLSAAGADRVITVDLHAGQIQGFFNMPVDNLFATKVILDYLRQNFKQDLVIVAPDAGGVERARAFAKRLNCGLCIIDKRRDAPNVAKAVNIIGDVAGLTAIIVDDMVDTAGTLTESAEAIMRKGAREVYASCSHPVLSGPALDRVNASVLRELVVTDTIDLKDKSKQCPKLKMVSVAGLLGEAIRRVYQGMSVSSLFV
ncbi:MAG: ribose-phosphate pyrophosphokinase [Proteobacteria bacterium]|nr:ribose-phosphate pyrophosphokinase [Pseudomonadota bacterium]